VAYIWSYTGLSQFKNCPYQFYRQRIVCDLPKEDTAALRAGREMHTMMETRLRDGKPLPQQFAHYEPFAQAVIGWPGETRAEVKLAVTTDWRPAAFFGNDAAGRGAIDVLNIYGEQARIVDWKTGGKVRRSDCVAQFRDNCALLFANYPDVQVIVGAWVYVGLREVCSGPDFVAAREPAFENEKARLEQALDAIRTCEDTGVWPCRPSGLCKGWCPVHDCKFWRPNPKVQR